MNYLGTPVVSIGMPVYNCEATLAPAIQSILQQTLSEWELLIVDDGSSDTTTSIARTYADPRIRIFCDGVHRGIVSRLNQAISFSRGRYFARMDGDDVSYPRRLAQQLEYLEQHPAIDLLGGSVVVFGQDGCVLGARNAPRVHEGICRTPWAGFFLAHPTWMGRTEWFRQHLYRADAVRCEDQDLLLRTYRQSRFAALPDTVLGYREEKLSWTKVWAGRRSFLRCFLREALPKHQYAAVTAGLLSCIFLGFRDLVAIGSGLNYRLLPHRALPIDPAGTLQWQQVWQAVQ